MKPFGIDHRVTDAVVSGRSEPWTSLLQFITVWGDTLTLSLVVIGVVVLAWMAGRIDFAVLIVVGSLSGWAMMVLLKAIFVRDRPPVGDRLIDIGGHSFPSGHAMLSVIVYGLTVLILHRLYPAVRAHPWWLLIGPILVALIGFSRIYLGVHWLSDVLFGWLFGVVWVSLCVAAHIQGSRRRQAARAARRAAMSSGQT
ncbi:phosphatase PAP2 family protein [Gordonia humi]|uniref:Undecaprenyl-diphosphatase n=1 Tax=Gordonia humi TaxID=686429 RepID=A0A840EXI6_9ACTN|nr:phosphatase PAP2 family protein [Gordonia humi]MBB4135034.1 undecaprenyl-diphosphatase [Gordonia humi]